MHYLSIWVEKLRKTTKTLSQDNRFPGPDSKSRSAECER